MRWGRSLRQCIAAVVSMAAAVLLAVCALPSAEAVAEGISGYVEYDYSRNETDLTAAGGGTVETRSSTFAQLYNLTLEKQVFPNLNVLASGTFQRRDNAFEVEGATNDTTTTTRRPYLNVNLRTPLYYAEVAASRNEEKVDTSNLTITTVRDAVVSTLYWKPDRYPDLKLQYLWDHLYDKEGLTVDTVGKAFQATSNYYPIESLWLYYQGTLRETDLRMSDTTAKETINNGRVNYTGNWWQRRIAVGLDYNVTDQRIDTTTSGAGEVGVRVFPFAGLSALSDTPENVVLVSNPALIDGNLTASTGINLGLPPPGGDSRLRNMGFDFLAATELNTLYVWVDRDISQVAGAFSWRIYTSDDNQNWVFRQLVSPAVYSPTFNRFEIRFGNVTARYVKAVTAPLLPTVPFATAYPTIFVTELQGEIRRPAAEVAGTVTSTSQNGTADLRALLLPSVNLTYELTYVFTDRSPGEMQYTVSNGLSFFRQFDKVFSGRGRVAYENGEEQAGYREAVLYSASLTAVPFPTLYSSFLFNGQDQTVAGRRNTNNSVFLYTTAKFYEGIDGNLNAGIGFQEDDEGHRNRNTQLNAAATFVPNQKVNLTLLYNGTANTASGGNLSDNAATYTRALEGDLSVTPIQALYLFGSYRVEWSSTLERRTILNYNINWAPFPDGALHLTFYYNETIRSDDFKERSIVPAVRWYFTRRSYLNLSYQNLKTESDALTTSSNIYSGTVRFTF